MPGWLPSEELERQARQTATDYLADLDGGKVEEAYTFLVDIDKKDQPYPAFSERVRQFNTRAGKVIERRIVTLTWTKNPAHAPLPGVYAALDLVSRFANVDRHCGYLVLYQAPTGGAFRVMREEDNFLDNASAADIERKSSAAAVDKTWAAISAHCPGYKPAPILSAQQKAGAPLPESGASSIGYPSVDAALAALHSKPGVVFTNQGGWTIADDDATQTIWSFSPPDYPAYPAVVKRQVIEKDGAVSIQMSVLCGASKQVCDDLVRTFEQMNARIGEGVRGQH